MITYLNDDSFFTNIHFPGQVGWYTLESWFRSYHIPQFRMIIDEEADYDALNLKDKLDLYPGIKTIATVVNPYVKALVGFERLSIDKAEGNESPYSKYFDLTSFESFVLSTPDVQFEDKWFKLTTPQVEWLEFIDDNGELKTVDYLIRAEDLDSGFKPIRDYFEIAEGLEHIEDYPNYRSLYSTEMKNKIESIWYKDMERYGYKF